MATKIKVLEPGLLQVQNFTNPEKWYVVDRLERSCTCECFKLRGWCKHLNFVLEHEADIIWEEKIWKAMKEFEEWRHNLIAERLKSFRPIDGKVRKALESAGWEYDEDLSALVWALITG